MAKVTNQIINGAEEMYTDASGNIYYMGEQYRHVLTGAYPLPSLNPSGVVRKSPRGYRPTEQGAGSDEQRQWRDCFRLCAERWRNLPDECPDPAPCPEVSSKKNIWNEKQEEGVPCSSYDLYMRCCLSHCTEITVWDNKGHAITGGVLPEDDPCFKCESPCKKSTLSIDYTTRTMAANESQALYAHDSQFGSDIPCCGAHDICWTIASGGGSLSDDTGLVTVYTAPADNPNCINNATIILSDCCGRTATLKIAINTYTGTTQNDIAYSIGECKTEGQVTAIPNPGGECDPCYDKWVSRITRLNNYFCDGTRVPPETGDHTDCASTSTSTHCTCDPTPFEPAKTCDELFMIGTNCVKGSSPCTHCPDCGGDGCILDVRSPEQISQGCCPEELF